MASKKRPKPKPSPRGGSKRVLVHSHCRRKPAARRSKSRVKEWGF